MVEVVNGGAGERCLSARFTLPTVKGIWRSSCSSVSTSSREAGSYFLPFFPW